MTIRVAEGSIVEMHYADDGKAVEEARWGSYETVGVLFALIEQAIAADAAQIDTQNGSQNPGKSAPGTSVGRDAQAGFQGASTKSNQTSPTRVLTSPVVDPVTD